MALEKIEVTLPAELIEFARSLVDGEDFVCFDDVLIEALCRFRPFIENERREREWLKAEVQKGIDQLDRGEGLDGEAVMAELLGRFRAAATTPTS
jgi:hypothetical protein